MHTTPDGRGQVQGPVELDRVRVTSFWKNLHSGKINTHIMKSLVLTALICCFYLDAMAGHSRGNGTCMDDITHYNNMKNKRTDAPLHAQSLAMYDKAIGKRMANKQAECEDLVEEALRMIRKTDGEYPTE